MISYAGIGSRDIKPDEVIRIRTIAKQMARRNFILYAGNADGADIAFQAGSNSQCILMLPWKRFNHNNYSTEACIEAFDLGSSAAGLASIDQFHPNPSALSDGARRIMARNYHQVHGYNQWPIVSFVICCSNEVNGKVIGGTGQAVRIAQSLRIPIFNIRNAGWGDALGAFLKTLNDKPSNA